MISGLVSIIIPCYNAKKYLKQAIDSVLAQTYPHCEVIVIDDGSTDSSLEILKKYHQLIRWETGPNRGGCAARNRGIEIANGEWIQFLDADDMLHPEKIATHVGLAKKHNVLAVTSPTYKLHQNETEWGWYPLPVFQDHKFTGIDFCVQWRLAEIYPLMIPSSIQECVFHSYPPSWLIHRNVLEQAGPWDEQLLVNQDTEYFERLCLHIPEIYFSGKTLSLYRVDVPGSVSKGRTRKHLESRLQYTKAAEKIFQFDNSERARIGVSRLYYMMILRCIPRHWDIIWYAYKKIKQLNVPRGSEASTPTMKKLCKYIGPIPAAIVLFLIKGKRYVQP